MIKVKTREFREARIKAGFSQRSMSRALGKSSAYTCLVEQGKISVSAQSAKQICELLGKKFEDLFEIVHSSSSSQATKTA